MGMKKILKRSLLKAKERQRQELDSKRSEHSGMVGLFENSIRRYKEVSHAAAILPLYAIAVVCLAIALTPPILLVQFVSRGTVGFHPLIAALALGLSFAVGFLLYGFTLITVVPIANFVLRTRLRPWRGPYFSAGSLRWYIHNVLAYVVRYTFLDFITPTPFGVLYFRWMGMKIGRDVQINTSNISDPSLIELGDRVTIAGSATLIAHYATSGFLIVAPLKIGKGATVGMKATIMGGVEIGEHATVLPNSVVLPKTVIPAGEKWGGVPARKIADS